MQVSRHKAFRAAAERKLPAIPLVIGVMFYDIRRHYHYSTQITIIQVFFNKFQAKSSHLLCLYGLLSAP